MFKLQHSNTPILQHSKAHGYVPDVQLILAAMDLSSYNICINKNFKNNRDVSASSEAWPSFAPFLQSERDCCPLFLFQDTHIIVRK